MSETKTNTVAAISSDQGETLFRDIAKLMGLAHARFETQGGAYTLINASPKSRKASQIGKIYLNTVEEVAGKETRQHLTCQCCRDFLYDFGAVQAIHIKTGERTPLFFCDHPQDVIDTVAPESYKVYSALRNHVSGLKLVEPVAPGMINADMGIRHEGGFDHFYAAGAPKRFVPVWTDASSTADYAAIRKFVGENRKILNRTGFDLAMAILEDGPRGKALVESHGWPWWDGIVTALEENRFTPEFTWGHMATAHSPHIFYPKSKATWDPYECICTAEAKENASQNEVDDAVRKARRMLAGQTNSKNYMRSTEGPTDTAIAEVDQIVREKTLTASFRRRWAGLEDVSSYFLWSNPEHGKESVVEDVGFFAAALKSADAKKNDYQQTMANYSSVPPRRVTVREFIDKIMPELQDLFVYTRGAAMSLQQFTTAVDPDAEPLMWWDSKDSRNPVAYYAPGLRNAVEQAHAFGIDRNRFGYRVMGLSAQPESWGQPDKGLHPASSRYDLGYVFYPEGIGMAKERGYDPKGCAIFSEDCIPELRAHPGMRQVIEAYSMQASMDMSVKDPVAGMAVSRSIYAGTPSFRCELLAKIDGKLHRLSLDRMD